MRPAQADRRQAERAGRIAELAALAWLVCTGHRLLARRYRAAGGEIDLVVRRGREFMARHHISPDLECRFDLIRISPFTWRESLPLQHLRDAWWCDPA